MINWKVRFKNKGWLVAMISLVVAFVYDVLGLLEITPRVDQSAIMALCNALLTVIGMIGVIQDPTTAGLGDSNRALGYDEPWKDIDK